MRQFSSLHSPAGKKKQALLILKSFKVGTGGSAGKVVVD